MATTIRDNLTTAARNMIRSTMAFIEAVKYGRDFCEIPEQMHLTERVFKQAREVERIKAKAEAHLLANPAQGPADFNRPHDYRVTICNL